MLSLLLALAVSQQAQPPEFPLIRPRIHRSDGPARISRAGQGEDYAFFEAFPASGAGMGLVAPLPNWVLRSEEFSTGWTLGFGGPSSAPTVTADQAANPLTGAMTADRIQFPAAPGGSFNAAYQGSITTCASVTCTFSVQVYGNGASGSLDVGIGVATPGTFALCNYVNGAWSTCMVTGIGTSVWIGGLAIWSGVAHTAADVFVANAMYNVGSSAAPYIATSTIAKGYTVTGAKGEALTFTRTGNAYATRTATGGLSTTGIANGDLVLMPTNQSRVEYDSAGVLGLRVEGARTNNVVRSQELDNVVWSEVETAGAVTVTADAANAPDGTNTAERIQVSACPTAGQKSVVSQSLATGTINAGTVYLRGFSGSGSIGFAMRDGNTASYSNSKATCSFVSTSWTRCTFITAIAANAAGSIEIGCNNDTGATGNTGAADVLVWGVGYEAGAYATSYIPTVAASATRNAETATFPVVISGVGSMAASIQPANFVGGVNVLRFNTDTALTATTGGAGQLYVNAANKANTAGAVALGASTRMFGWWSATESLVSTAGTSSGLGTAASATATTTLGLQQGSGGLYTSGPHGIISRVCVDPSPTRCR